MAAKQVFVERAVLTTGAVVLEVRYRPEVREQFAAKLAPLVRRQAVATIVLGCLWGLLTASALLLVFVTDGVPVTLMMILLVVGLEVVPILLVVVGARHFGFMPTLPEVVLTVTGDEVIFAPLSRVTLLSRSRSEQRWVRRATKAEFLPKSGFAQDRIKFTSHVAGRRRTVFQTVGYLDTPVEVILDAVRRR